MMICLKTSANQLEPTRVKLHLVERLPFFIISDCELVCDYLVRQYKDFYLLMLDVSGVFRIQCQRCLNAFQHHYVNHTELAICRDESTTVDQMDQFECIVSNRSEIDLISIVTDELHLYAPERHIYCARSESEVFNLLFSSQLDV